MGRKNKRAHILDQRYTPYELDPAEDYIYGYTGEPGKRITDWKEIYAGLISGKIKTEGAKLLSEYKTFDSKIGYGGMDTMRRLALVRYLNPGVFGMLDPDTGEPISRSKNDPDSAFYGITFKELNRERSEGEFENKRKGNNPELFSTSKQIDPLLIKDNNPESFSKLRQIDPLLIRRSEGEEEIDYKRLSSIYGIKINNNNPRDEAVSYVTKSEYDNQLKGLAQYIAAVNTELNIADDTKEIEALNARAQAIQTNMERQREMNRRARSTADIRRRLALRGSGTFRPKTR